MPTLAKRYCTTPFCPELVDRGGRCANHTRRLPDDRPTAWRRGYGRGWKALRAYVLSIEPTCRTCRADGRVTPATDVDHVVPLARGGSNDIGNLQPLCHACHSRKTAREDGGFGR